MNGCKKKKKKDTNHHQHFFPQSFDPIKKPTEDEDDDDYKEINTYSWLHKLSSLFTLTTGFAFAMASRSLRPWNRIYNHVSSGNDEAGKRYTHTCTFDSSAIVSGSNYKDMFKKTIVDLFLISLVRLRFCISFYEDISSQLFTYKILNVKLHMFHF